MPLTDVAVRSAKSREKMFKLSDSGGLYLQVITRGGKRWRWKYRVAGVEMPLVRHLSERAAQGRP
jgi:hypothetical protein